MILNANKVTRIDPTRTSFLRLRFTQDLNRRFSNLQRAINQRIVTQDALGIQTVTANTVWKFLPNAEKLKQFQSWFLHQIAKHIFSTQGGDSDEPWIFSYVKAAYAKGLDRAFGDTQSRKRGKKLDFYTGSKQQFLFDSFSHPVSVEKVKLIQTRSFAELKGITEAMSQGISRELTQGMILGLNPRDIARNLNAKVNDIGKARSLTMARTEVVSAHAEGQLDAFERLGVTELGVAVEWSTAQDEHVCPKCRPLEGVVFSVQEARGILPRHPNCRCAWIPANVGEKSEPQKKTQARIKSAIESSLKREKKSTWAGKQIKVSKVRPKAIV